MAQWVRAASLASLPPGSAKEVHAEGRIVALFNIDGNVHAIDGICPHQGGPLGEGTLEDQVVTCPWHGWQFDVTTGKNLLNPQIQQSCLEVRVEGDDIYLSL